MKNTLYILMMALSVLSCVREDLPEEGWTSDEVTGVSLSFGSAAFDQVQISTKATLGIVPESRVQNIFMYIFNSEGDRVFSHFFDNRYRVETEAEMTAPDGNCWWVHNMVNPGEDATRGIIHIKAPVLSGGKIYMIANIDADMVNISPERLNTLMSEHEFNNLVATFNQTITSRNGYFPMYAMADDIDITPENGIKRNGGDVSAEFERLDAKIVVDFKVAKGHVTVTEDSQGREMKQVMQKFVPTSWRAVNLPTNCYVKPHDKDSEGGYFSTEPVAFETEDGDVHGFSFYMIENREAGKKSVGGNYHLRDRRVKDPATGAYVKGGDMWEYAPENATYLEVKGEVVMDVDVTSEAGAQTLTADVTYYIHLGDFASDKDNYEICRNTIYNYDILIKGVSSIEMEVTSSASGRPEDVVEKESGATGMVYVAQEDLYTFDAHYGQRVFEFDGAHIIPSQITWYVKTPFSEGIPDKVGESEVTAHLDYKWVHFMVNETVAPDNDQVIPGMTGQLVYSDHNQAYPGDGSPDLMNIVEFTKYIKNQKLLLEDYLDGNTVTNTSAFLPERDPVWKTSFPDDQSKWDRYKLRVTVFVDEFYYEHDPIDPSYAPVDLWKRFVNQPNRIMHLLSDSQTSLDGESIATGSIVTIRQSSIQTPYNTNNLGLETAWGGETVDETADSYLWFYSTSESNNNTTYSPGNLYNNSLDNGLYNTAHLIGILNRNDQVQSVYWTGSSGMMDYDRPNEFLNSHGYPIGFMKEDKAVMRYSVLMRNRDNNGNGIIDPEELRWYMASVNQLCGLYMGQLGLSESAQLYTLAHSNNTGSFASGPYTGTHKWRSHVISSTSSGDERPIFLWAEEGVSTSFYKQDYEWGKPGPYSIRCVRNLGLDNGQNIADQNAVPESLIKVIEPDGTVSVSSVYQFDLSNINDKSLRFYTTRELEAYNEHFETARLYCGFETGSSVPFTAGYSDDQGNGGLKGELDAGRSPCPDGYRVPNVREGALMHLYCKNSAWWEGETLVSTYYSNGKLGNRNDASDKSSPSWFFDHDTASIDGGSSAIRCVRDWNPPAAQ